MKNFLVTDFTKDFFEDTRLLGITTPVKKHYFCWQLNNLLGLNFRLNTDLEIVLRKNRDYFFSIYEWKEQVNSLTHYLYHNQNDGEYLLPEFKHIDFLWLMKNDWVDDAKCNYIVQSIRSIGDVQLVTELTYEKIKNKTNMMF